MSAAQDDQSAIAVIQEHVFVTKADAITDRVRVRTVTDSCEIVVEERLQRGLLDIQRAFVDREVPEAPPPRHDGDLLVISIVEERLVKRLFVTEEVRILQTTAAETVSLPTTLRSMRAIVEHDEESTTTGSL